MSPYVISLMILLAAAPTSYCLGAGSASGGEVERDGTANSSGNIVIYPPEDDNEGELYEHAADLLAELRDLPAGVSFGVVEDTGEDDGEEAMAPVESGEERWVRLTDGPVTRLENLGWTHFRAGDFDRAGRIYRELVDRHPENGHYKVLLFLCLRRTGEEVSAELMEDMEELDGRKWLDRLDRVENEFSVEETNE